MAWRSVIQGLPDEHSNGISMAEKARAIGVINTMADEPRAQRIIAGLEYPNATPEELIATVQLLLGPAAASAASGADQEGLYRQVQRLTLAAQLSVTNAQTVGQNVHKVSQLDDLLTGILSEVPDTLAANNLKQEICRLYPADTKAKENSVQGSLDTLFKKLQAETSADFEVHDTSGSGWLTNPTAKVDLTFTASDKVVWSSVVWVAEVKSDLRSKTQYEEGTGQVADRAWQIFPQQPQRSHVIAAVLGAGTVEVYYIPKDAGQIRRTGILEVDPQDPSSAGVLMLLRLFYSKAARHFGYVRPAVPGSWTPQDLQQPLCNFLLLRDKRSPRNSCVYSAEFAGGGNDPQQVVVKFSEDIQEEVDILGHLDAAGVQRTPRVLASGNLQGFGPFMVTPHLGAHLTELDSAELIAQVTADIADTICACGDAGILHRDVSAGNIVTLDGRGYLIDFQMAKLMSATAGAECGAVVTGTPLFSACSVLKGDSNTVSSDLESLLYVLVHVASGEKLPGRYAMSPRTAGGDKLLHFLLAFDDEILPRCKEGLKPLIQQLRELFFRGNTYRTDVTCQDFQAVCHEQLKKLRQPAPGNLRNQPPPPGPQARLQVHGGSSNRSGDVSRNSGRSTGARRDNFRSAASVVRAVSMLRSHQPTLRGGGRRGFGVPGPCPCKLGLSI